MLWALIPQKKNQNDSSSNVYVDVVVVSPKDGGRGRRQRDILLNIETIRTIRCFPSSIFSFEVSFSTLHASRTAPHSIADRRAIAKNRALSFAVTFPHASAMFKIIDKEALFS